MTALRCRPGDMAIVIRADPATRELIGKVVQVSHLIDPSPCGLPRWALAQSVRITITEPCRTSDGHLFKPGQAAWLTASPDAYLQPLNDPGVAAERHVELAAPVTPSPLETA